MLQGDHAIQLLGENALTVTQVGMKFNKWLVLKYSTFYNVLHWAEELL